jgi:hypothetical protein
MLALEGRAAVSHQQTLTEEHHRAEERGLLSVALAGGATGLPPTAVMWSASDKHQLDDGILARWSSTF